MFRVDKGQGKVLRSYAGEGLTDIRKADPVARRQAMLLVLLGGIVGGLLIAGFEHYHQPLRDWLLSGQGSLKLRLTTVLIMMAAVIAMPLGWFALFLWSLRGKVLKAGEYPPPGCQVIHDTPVVRGKAAVSVARALQVVALVLMAAIVLFCFLFWRLFLTLTAQAV
jgi:hypothetical protein